MRGSLEIEGLEASRIVDVGHAANGQARYVIACRHDIRLYVLIGPDVRKGARSGHRRLVEYAGRAVGVVTAVSQKYGALLAHRIVTASLIDDPASIVEYLKFSFLGISAHGAPVVRLAVCGSGHEAPVDALEGLAELVVRVRIHAAHEVVFLVGHDPWTRTVSVVPGSLGSEIRGLHGAVSVVTAVGLGIAIVKAAA